MTSQQRAAFCDLRAILTSEGAVVVATLAGGLIALVAAFTFARTGVFPMDKLLGIFIAALYVYIVVRTWRVPRGRAPIGPPVDVPATAWPLNIRRIEASKATVAVQQVLQQRHLRGGSPLAIWQQEMADIQAYILRRLHELEVPAPIGLMDSILYADRTSLTSQDRYAEKMGTAISAIIEAACLDRRT